MTVYVRDTFNRTTSSSWGTPNIGPAWSMNSSGQETISVNGSHGIWSSPTSNNAIFPQATIMATNIRMEATITLDKFPTGGDVTPRFICRTLSATDYNIRFSFKADGTVRLFAARGESAFVVSNIIPAILPTYPLNTPIRLVGEVVGTAPTAIRAKAWLATDPEPAWDLDALDNVAEYQIAGYPILRLHQQSTVTNKPITYTVDDVLIWDGAGSPTGFEVSVWDGASEVTGATVSVWDGTQEQPVDMDSLSS